MRASYLLIGFLSLNLVSCQLNQFRNKQVQSQSNNLKELVVAVQANKNPNRLLKEKSPYLLQHAYNPVDWYAWGEEAFQKAKKENKPIFLSIGYSTCHWCHVMEEESFENAEIAKILNEHFVPIKVDREERPDVDFLYMQAVQMLAGSGGWPLSVFLTPDLKPFHGGTYFPPEDRWGRPGFKSILTAITDTWIKDRDRVETVGAQFVKALQDYTASSEVKTHATPLNQKVLQDAYEQFSSRFDQERGGFSEAPKFPMGHTLSFLLRYWKHSGASVVADPATLYGEARHRRHDQQPLRMVEKTLEEMAKGGLYDQLGGGFHRYSTDENWHVPHFEKMLYDQALLSRAYLEAYQATGKESFARIARETFDYVLRDLTGNEGAFYSAEDADSVPPESAVKEAAAHGTVKKVEGAFYLWRNEEIRLALGDRDGEIFSHAFGVTKDGNAKPDPHGEFIGKNILHLTDSFETFEPKVRESIKHSKQILLEIRSARPRPHLDDKILTDWNGLMISSLAFGSRVLNEPIYLEAARKAADFVLTRMNDQKGMLFHRYRDGEAAIPGFLEDYAFFIHGLIDLYEATFEIRYLEESIRLAKEMIRLFWDESAGGFFLSGKDAEQLIIRSKEIYDGAIPSGNSVAVLSLVRLSRMTLDHSFEKYAEQTVQAFSEPLSKAPAAYLQMMIAFDFLLGPSKEIVITGRVNDPKINEMVLEVFSRFLPNRVILFHPSEGEDKKKIETLSSFLEKQLPIAGKVTAYVCQNHACDLPTTDVATLNMLLQK
ncbi:MAG: thioredoxin domain-containing protein [Candidatus Omnitrophica bacterium]|nr:thioredoxin domain-containing protein [Candidatus Omnitrophota bacterium]